MLELSCGSSYFLNFTLKFADFRFWFPYDLGLKVLNVFKDFFDVQESYLSFLSDHTSVRFGSPRIHHTWGRSFPMWYQKDRYKINITSHLVVWICLNFNALSGTWNDYIISKRWHVDTITLNNCMPTVHLSYFLPVSKARRPGVCHSAFVRERRNSANKLNKTQRRTVTGKD